MLYIKIQRLLEEGDLRLRPLSLADGPFLTDGLRDKAILSSNFLSKPIDSSWFLIWWWFKKTYILPYCIELDSRRIGFIGLYNLIADKSAEMSLVIFDKNSRRCGYSSRAFNIFTKNLKMNSVVKDIIVKIKADNHAAISFYKKLGFGEFYHPQFNKDIKTMSIDLANRYC